LVPVPRSGESQASLEADSDPYPCRTIAQRIAEFSGHGWAEVLTRTSPRTAKHSIAGNKVGLVATPVAPDWRHVVLVDDTLTSGATLMACALRLREAGFAGRIHALCVGRTVDRAEKLARHAVRTRVELVWDRRSDRPEQIDLGGW